MNSERASADETDAMLAAAGITVTAEGRERARARLRAADERMTPEAWERLRARLGRAADAA
ncbi:hypothetical protein Val02_11470 [Virgisporangium aliadipatigenens]|uniref:Uncharacterized protein n=1 Tax=Virgisporangium aliadipatigenens TaxID=741659 RepID=A0A8J4DNX2_9ACTN|nr:hypothetical protein [Virgisporangium aliadipatigenens]GIJ44261.1 hypothetical protein Val02_11470 [Virgisporangium aliadipatigenens]